MVCQGSALQNLILCLFLTGSKFTTSPFSTSATMVTTILRSVIFVKPKPITRSTRNSCKLDMSVPFYRTKLFQKSYFDRTPKLWNNLPPNTCSSSSVSNFKSVLYKHYLIALSNSSTYNIWRTICPKCSVCKGSVRNYWGGGGEEGSDICPHEKPKKFDPPLTLARKL